MANIQTGADALNALNQEGNSGTNNEFSSFKSGTTYHVKVLGTADLISFYSYGIFKQVNSFVAEKPSKKSANGFPVENLTPWDKAWKYHKDLSEEWTDEHGQEASKYRAKHRFAFGFYDITAGDFIVIDLSKKQAQAIHGAIKKFEKRLGKMSFELSKTGEGTGTVVSLTPVMFPDEDLTDEQRKNFVEAPEKFDASKFDGILYEMDDDEQIEKLIEVGFDVSLIGLEAPAKKAASEGEDGGDDESTDISDDDLPF